MDTNEVPTMLAQSCAAYARSVLEHRYGADAAVTVRPYVRDNRYGVSIKTTDESMRPVVAALLDAVAQMDGHTTSPIRGDFTVVFTWC